MNEQRKLFYKKLNKILATNVKKYREKNNLTQEQLSLLILKPKNYIKNLEELKNKKLPEFYTFVYISRVLKITTDDLITKEEALKICEEVGFTFDIYDVK